MTPDPSTAAPLRLLSSMATRELLATIADRLNGRPGIRLTAESAGGVDVARRVRAGEACDIVVLAADAIDSLIADGFLWPDTRTPIADSAMGIAAHASGPRPDISSVPALCAALRAAASIGYSTGPSGNHLLKMLKTLGLEHEVAPKLKLAPAGTPVGQFIASGQVELGFQQISELTELKDVALIGPLPDAVQLVTTFTAAASRASQRLQEARSAIAALADPEHDALKRALGLTPTATPSSNA